MGTGVSAGAVQELLDHVGLCGGVVVHRRPVPGGYLLLGRGVAAAIVLAQAQLVPERQAGVDGGGALGDLMCTCTPTSVCAASDARARAPAARCRPLPGTPGRPLRPGRRRRGATHRGPTWPPGWGPRSIRCARSFGPWRRGRPRAAVAEPRNALVSWVVPEEHDRTVLRATDENDIVDGFLSVGHANIVLDDPRGAPQRESSACGTRRA